MLHVYSENPRYLAVDGHPVVLVGSGEHYGALINRAFDYNTYFETLRHDELNQCRLFSGVYREQPREFGIEENVLAPRDEDFCTPWARTEEGKYDLNRWNDEYFERLHAVMTSARANGVCVELVLFCFWYNDGLWKLSPLHPDNSVPSVGPADREEFWNVNGPLLPYQEAFVRKIVTELNPYPNVYFELINEPYSRHDHTDYFEFQNYMAGVIADCEVTLPTTHLIAVNIQNRAKRVTQFPEQATILNFHYARTEAVSANYHLKKVLADDETGFAGQKATPYRREAWSFLMSGGGIFSHLDYSFNVAHPAGDGPIYGKTPGFGSPLLRKQFGFLRRFVELAAVWEMEPVPEIFVANSGDIAANALGRRGDRYAIYMAHSQVFNTFAVGLPAGTFSLRWFDPIGCHELAPGRVEHPGGYLHLPVAVAADEMALLVTRTGEG
ncbi:MAG: hypothetical protein SFU56_22000 [Capsulimonadales bacterium]|nr:hypothetical protein [Capsulimonadales bacterium]